VHLEDGSALLNVEFLDHPAQAALRNYDFARQIQHVIKFFDIGAQRPATCARERVEFHR
jgi:hypothetical protein